jgi:hypothetical protein
VNDTVNEIISNKMPWLRKLRLRVFAVMVGLLLAAIGVVGLASWPALPVVGVTLTIATVVVNKMTAKLSVMTCSGCGADLTGVPTGAYGAVCKDCGVINTNHAPPARLAKSPQSDKNA